MTLIWTLGIVGYYGALVIGIIAQRTRYIHGKYSHSWVIGTILLIFGLMQIAGAPDASIAVICAASLVMPLIVTAIDVADHRRQGRGLFGHHPHCWMQDEEQKQQQDTLTAIQRSTEDWSSR